MLRLGGGVAAGLCFPVKAVWSHGEAKDGIVSPRLRHFVDPLPLMRPRLRPVDSLDGAPVYRIAIRSIRQKLHRDLPPTALWAYEGQFPGPTIDVRRGQKIFVRWQNELADGDFLIHGVFDTHLHGTHAGEPQTKTVTHLHGAVVPPDSDGRPDAWFTAGFKARGAEWTREVYEYPNNQDACTLWYHDHAIGQTRLNVYAGLAGVYVIRDEAEDALGLPADAYEIPLLIQDRSFAADGSLAYLASKSAGTPDHPGPWVPEFFGDVNLVNGKAWPYLEVEPRKYRFRVVNGANARFYRLRLSDGRPFVQIGTDQGLLPAPAEVSKLLLSPAERADVIVDFRGAAGKSIVLFNDAPAPFPGGKEVDARTTARVMQFRVVKPLSRPDRRPIPQRLRPIAPLAEGNARIRHMAFREYKDANDEPIIVLLNARKWSEPIDTKPKLGDVEIWNLINTTDDSHPIHLHLVRFQILDRQEFDSDDYLKAWGAQTPGNGPDPIPVEPYLRGSRNPPAPDEAGWKDTVRADPKQVTRIIARFDGYAGKYPWHCHMLEHEDNEMMLQFEVVA